MTHEELREFVVRELETKLRLLGFTKDDVTLDLDLFAAGLIDSMGLIELISAIEDRFGVGVKLDDVDPEEIYSVAGLARHASARH